MVSEKRRDLMQIYKCDKELKIEDKGIYYREKLWVPYLHEMFMDGKWDHKTENDVTGTKMATYNVDAEILKNFPELKDRRTVRILILEKSVEEM